MTRQEIINTLKSFIDQVNDISEDQIRSKNHISIWCKSNQVKCNKYYSQTYANSFSVSSIIKLIVIIRLSPLAPKFNGLLQLKSKDLEASDFTY